MRKVEEEFESVFGWCLSVTTVLDKIADRERRKEWMKFLTLQQVLVTSFGRSELDGL